MEYHICIIQISYLTFYFTNNVSSHFDQVMKLISLINHFDQVMKLISLINHFDQVMKSLFRSITVMPFNLFQLQAIFGV